MKQSIKNKINRVMAVIIVLSVLIILPIITSNAFEELAEKQASRGGEVTTTEDTPHYLFDCYDSMMNACTGGAPVTITKDGRNRTHVVGNGIDFYFTEGGYGWGTTAYGHCTFNF